MRLLFCAVLLSGCSIRAVATFETEDAVYGSTQFRKELEQEDGKGGKNVSTFGSTISNSISAITGEYPQPQESPEPVAYPTLPPYDPLPPPRSVPAQ